MRAWALILALAPVAVSSGLSEHEMERPGWRCLERTGTTVEHWQFAGGPIIQRNVCARWAPEKSGWTESE